MRIMPFLRSGYAPRNTQAKTNINKGPITQLRVSDPVSMVFDPLEVTTFFRSSYRTLASGGYIIKIKSIAIGIDVVPMLKVNSIFNKIGKKFHSTMYKEHI